MQPDCVDCAELRPRKLCVDPLRQPQTHTADAPLFHTESKCEFRLNLKLNLNLMSPSISSHGAVCRACVGDFPELDPKILVYRNCWYFCSIEEAQPTLICISVHGHVSSFLWTNVERQTDTGLNEQAAIHMLPAARRCEEVFVWFFFFVIIFFPSSSELELELVVSISERRQHHALAASSLRSFFLNNRNSACLVKRTNDVVDDDVKQKWEKWVS